MSLMLKREGKRLSEKMVERKVKKEKEDSEAKNDNMVFDEDQNNAVVLEPEIRRDAKPINLLLGNYQAPKPTAIPTAQEMKARKIKEYEDEDEYDGFESGEKDTIKSKFSIDEEKLQQYIKQTSPSSENDESTIITKKTQPVPAAKSGSTKEKEMPVFGPVSESDLQKVEEIHNRDVESFIMEEYDSLSPLEKDILEIAKTILKKKKLSAEIEVDHIDRCSELVQKLHEKCIAKLKYTKGYSAETIFEAIKGLEAKQWIVTDHRRTKKEIIESEPLLKVLEFIKQNPGIHARHQKIQDELNISRNPFIKHVMVLEAFGLVRSIKFGRTQNYFFSELPDIFDNLVVLFQNDLIVNMINLVLENPDITLTKIAENLNVYHSAIQYHIKTLKDLDLMEQDDNNRFIINKNLLQRYNKLYKIPPFNV